MNLIKALGSIFLLLASWRLWHAGQTAERFRETIQQLLIAYEPFYYLLAVSVAIYAMALVLKSIAPNVPMGQIFRGIRPFWFAMAAIIVLLIVFPQIALFLPQTIGGG